MDWPIRAFDSFRVEEAYNWRDDVMEITRRIVHETDEARLSNIANHFEVDLSEIRAFFEMKQQQQRKPQTNADKIRSLSDEELAEFFHDMIQDCGCNNVPCQQFCKVARNCELAWLDWLKGAAEE